VIDPKSILLSRRARFVAAAIAAAGIAVHDQAARGESPPTPPTEETRRTASERFERGRLLFEEGNYDAAHFEFERSHELVPDPRALRMLAECDERRNDWASAYARYVELDDREHAEAARARCAEIELALPQKAAEVRVDDVITRANDGRLIVNAGRRKLTIVYGPSSLPETRVVSLAAGDTVTVTFNGSPSPCLVPAPRSCHCDVPGIR
jgi:hypothetical protein